MKTMFRYFPLYIFMAFALSFNALADQRQDPELTLDMLDRYSLISPEVLARRHYWAEIGLQSDIGFNESGLQTGLGYRLNYFGFDLRFSAGKTSYGMIRSIVTKNEATEATDSSTNVELELSRNNSDSWSYWYLEPGLSLSSRLFSGYLPQFTERVRVGFIYGNFTDNVNHIPFKSFILNAETSLIYQLKPEDRWSFCGSLNWNSGMLVRYYADGQGNKQSYGLPIGWIGTTLSMIYAF